MQVRIAYQICLLAEKFGQSAEHGIKIGLKLSRSELAQLAGTINESLSRHLGVFKSRGWVDLSGKDIVVTNLEALKEVSGNFRRSS